MQFIRRIKARIYELEFAPAIRLTSAAKQDRLHSRFEIGKGQTMRGKLAPNLISLIIIVLVLVIVSGL